MSLSNDDLEDYAEKFRNIFHKQNNHKVNESDMMALIDNLVKELDLSKEREDCLQNNFKKYLECENADITTKFVYLEEKCEQFEKENADLNSKLNDMEVKATANAELQRNEYLQKLTELEEKYKCDISALKKQIENDTITYKTKENELYNEIQFAQAGAALQCDEIESTLKRQLVDTNNKLRNSQNVIRNLQTNVNNLRNELAAQQARSHRVPSKLEIKFQPLPVTSTKHSITYENSESEDLEYTEAPHVENSALWMKSAPVRQTSTPLAQTSPLDRNQLNSAPLVFKGTNTSLTKTVRRKRKLYDPDSFDRSNMPTYN